MRKYIVLFATIIATTFYGFAQKVELGLPEIVDLAKNQSQRRKLAQTQNEISFFQFQSFQSSLNPQISFYGSAPVYNKEYYGVRQPNGTILFQSINQFNSSVGLSLTQLIPQTGVEISINTNLTRFEDIKNKTLQYTGTPVFLKLSQPVFGFNQLKWSRKIEPLKFEESKRAYVLELENIAQSATQLFFDLIEAKSNISIATTNLKNAETNYQIENKRIILGTTTEDKLLQLELQILNSRQSLEKAKYDLQIAELSLSTFIGSKQALEFEPVIPEVISELNIDYDKAIQYAKKNRPDFVAFERKRQESLRDISQAKSANKQINIIASYGLNTVGGSIDNLYQNPNSQQVFNLGFSIPIVDWGRAKARINISKTTQKLTEFNNESDEATLLQQISTVIKNINLLKSLIKISHDADSLSLLRYNITNSLYQIGKLTATDLSLVQNEKDNARRNYINALRQFWDNFYLIRRLTLYDFEKEKDLYE